MILIGYWRETWPEGGYPGMRPEQDADYEALHPQGLGWPDPMQYVDDSWDAEARSRSVRHLETGTLVNQCRGISPCRFCGEDNGTAEMTDGTYCWPEGLAHYVRHHNVRLPDEFVQHVEALAESVKGLPTPTFDKLGMRDRTWPGPVSADLLWTPTELDHGQAYVDVDATWWLQQAG